MHNKGQMPMKGQMEQGIKRELNITDLIDNTDMEALFSYKDLAEKLPVYSQKTDIKVELTALEKNELLYVLRIPFDRIEKVRSSEYAIGIVSGEREMSQMAGGPPQGGGMSGGQGGGQGGGQRVGQGSAPGGESNRNSNMQNIDIWFKILMDRGE